MIRVITTHIGSLPFSDIQEAMEYTFSYDLPCLFTLPKLDPKQFMGVDILEMTNVDYRKQNGKLEFSYQNLEESQKMIPPYWDDFKAELEIRNISKFKYQLIGPFSFWKMLTKDSKISLQKLAWVLIKKYTETLKLFKDYKVLFLLDEPFLDKISANELEILNEFLHTLDTSFSNIKLGIHCCAKITAKTYEQLATNYIHLDLSLYELNELANFKQLKFLSFGHRSQEYREKYQSQLLEEVYLAPACGLAFVEVLPSPVTEKRLILLS